MEKYSFRIIILIWIFSFALAAQNITLTSRYNYFMEGQSGQILLDLPSDFSADEYQISLDRKLIARGKILPEQSLIEFPLSLIILGENKLKIKFDNLDTTYNITISKYPRKPEAVQIDNLTSSLLVNGDPYFPFGFYSYWPLQKNLLENEVVNGFNLISPYHKILDAEIEERRAYLDRCAELGMKVNYNICTLAGGGGVGTSKFALSEKKLNELLRKEVETFKDHPAILSWYIADEPVLNGVDPKELSKKYYLIKSIDPCHPVSVVFVRPSKAAKYAECFDIAMADPYPIPANKITMVSARTNSLQKVLPRGKVIWVVPQAFGGGEWWQREPTRQEIRNMTYQAIIAGAKGIKYFVRNGLNSFPKSTATWAECGAVATEIAEITPQLLSTEIAPEIICGPIEVYVRAWQADGLITVLAVNTQNEPLEANFLFPGSPINGRMNLPFENRLIELKNGKYTDIIDALGTRCYQYEFKPASDLEAESNLAYNGDFEEYYSPGVVAGFYASTRGEYGVTYFSDSQVAYSGRHSLRLINPTAKEGMRLRTYPVKLAADQNYMLSIHAKAKVDEFIQSRDRNFWEKLFKADKFTTEPMTFRLALNGNEKVFTLSEDWQEFTIDIPAITKEKRRVISLEFLGKGTAWFDLVQVVPSLEISSLLQNNKIMVEIKSSLADSPIYYTTDGSKPTVDSILYSGSFELDKTSLITAARAIGNEMYNETAQTIFSHKAIGKDVEYQHNYRDYIAGGKLALVDGIIASNDYLDGKWQGFIYDDLDVTIDLEEIKEIQRVEVQFLENHKSWIFLPKKVSFQISSDGENFSEVGQEKVKIPHKYRTEKIYTISKEIDSKARYVRVIASNVQYCPAWHRGKGKPAWLFVDEITVE